MLLYQPEHSYHKYVRQKDRIQQMTFLNCTSRRWWWPLNAVLSLSLLGVWTLNIVENIYRIDATGIHGKNAWFLDLNGIMHERDPELLTWENTVCPGQQSSVPGEFQDKKTWRDRWQAGRAVPDHHFLTYVAMLLMCLISGMLEFYSVWISFPWSESIYFIILFCWGWFCQFQHSEGLILIQIHDPPCSTNNNWRKHLQSTWVSVLPWCYPGFICNWREKVTVINWWMQHEVS